MTSDLIMIALGVMGIALFIMGWSLAMVWRKLSNLRGSLYTDYVSQKYHDSRAQTMWNEISKLQVHRTQAEAVFQKMGFVYRDEKPGHWDPITGV